MAEREGFEPSKELSSFTRLAGERLQPTRPSLPKLRYFKCERQWFHSGLKRKMRISSRNWWLFKKFLNDFNRITINRRIGQCCDAKSWGRTQDELEINQNFSWLWHEFMFSCPGFTIEWFYSNQSHQRRKYKFPSWSWFFHKQSSIQVGNKLLRKIND